MKLLPILLAVVAIPISACSRNDEVRCPGGTRYLTAESADELRVPDDLDVPDEAEALRIPPRTPPAEQADEDTCLPFSPAFSGEVQDQA